MQATSLARGQLVEHDELGNLGCLARACGPGDYNDLVVAVCVEDQLPVFGNWAFATTCKELADKKGGLF